MKSTSAALMLLVALLLISTGLISLILLYYFCNFFQFQFISPMHTILSYLSPLCTHNTLIIKCWKLMKIVELQGRRWWWRRLPNARLMKIADFIVQELGQRHYVSMGFADVSPRKLVPVRKHTSIQQICRIFLIILPTK